ncbi:hypothetical protein HW555_004621 [Spodoptera exigua]|uniref:Uncharacterized protein n=1 Tax=Spodoptera exigua TaxID=7107 RepID=A0A835GJW1_SPOEX|nr:hypothetical protein HW555_004621 [Spodoptera exigua]
MLGTDVISISRSVIADVRRGVVETADNEECPKHPKFLWKPFLRQFYVCTVCTSIYFVLGLCFGAPTVYIPQLRKEMQANATGSQLTDDMASWLYSIFMTVIKKLVVSFHSRILLYALGDNPTNTHALHRKENSVSYCNCNDTSQLHRVLLQYQPRALVSQ